MRRMSASDEANIGIQMIEQLKPGQIQLNAYRDDGRSLYPVTFEEGK